MVSFYTYLEIYLDDLHKRVSLSEFEKKFKKPHQTIKSHLQELVDAKILLCEKKERFLFFSLNLQNPLTKEFLVMCEKERLFLFLQKTLFKRLYEFLSEFLNNNKVLIFGSSVKNDKFSDIDLLIISKDEKIKKRINEFSKTYNVKIHCIQTEVKDVTESFKIELKKNHICLNNHEFFVEVLYKHELKLV